MESACTGGASPSLATREDDQQRASEKRDGASAAPARRGRAAADTGGLAERSDALALVVTLERKGAAFDALAALQALLFCAPIGRAVERGVDVLQRVIPVAGGRRARGPRPTDAEG